MICTSCALGNSRSQTLHNELQMHLAVVWIDLEDGKKEKRKTNSKPQKSESAPSHDQPFPHPTPHIFDLATRSAVLMGVRTSTA